MSSVSSVLMGEMPRRVPEKMRLAREIAADPLKLAEAQDDIASLCLSSDNSNAGRVRSYNAILAAAKLQAWPMSSGGVSAWMAALLAAGYSTIDDAWCVLREYARQMGQFGLSHGESDDVDRVVGKLKRKGMMRHQQKRPVFLDRIVQIKSKTLRGRALLP